MHLSTLFQPPYSEWLVSLASSYSRLASLIEFLPCNWIKPLYSYHITVWNFTFFFKLLYAQNTITQRYNIKLISTFCAMVDCHQLKHTDSTSCRWSLGQILAYAHVQGTYANEIHPRGGIQGRDQACFHGVLKLCPRSDKNIFSWDATSMSFKRKDSLTHSNLAHSDLLIQIIQQPNIYGKISIIVMIISKHILQWW